MKANSMSVTIIALIDSTASEPCFTPMLLSVGVTVVVYLVVALTVLSLFRMLRYVALIEAQEVYVRTRNGRFELHWVDPFGGETEEQTGEDKIVAPLPGTVVALLAEVGATLEKGAPILTLEVMKMEQTLRAPFAGVLKAIKCKVGDIVQEGVELAIVEPAA